ncbi:AbiEi antitoxin N-terminal domain-containing protein [Pseudomonas putida]|uniref:AbiEi antitoxin N-terminal domain-containing protein n=1 Tax=Pseudomonas putida TaxID=303 RepID=UPI0034A0473F
MSVAESIAKRVKRMSRGRPFTKALFAEEGSRTSVNKALSRMARSGLLERVARGIYMRPKESPNKPSVMRESPQHLIRAAHEPDELFRL